MHQIVSGWQIQDFRPVEKRPQLVEFRILPSGTSSGDQLHCQICSTWTITQSQIGLYYFIRFQRRVPGTKHFRPSKYPFQKMSFQVPPRGQFSGSLASALHRISLAGSLIQSFISDSLDAHGLGRKTVQFAQNYDDDQQVFNPSVFLLKSQLSSSEAHQMSQNDLWTFYAKELLNHFNDEPSIKYLAITNVTK